MESSVVAPAIVIAVTDECSEQWRDVLLGIEEEGIPFVLQAQTGGDLVHYARQAAQRSPLLVGIACDREQLIVHYKNLPASTPLFSLRYHRTGWPGETLATMRLVSSKGSHFGIAMLNPQENTI